MVVDDAEHSAGGLARIGYQVLLPHRGRVALSNITLGRHLIGREQ